MNSPSGLSSILLAWQVQGLNPWGMHDFWGNCDRVGNF
jgi:hypothetical protein